jgi:hypothetical protein
VPAAVKLRRFPLPWSTEDNDACFVIRDQGDALAHVDHEEELEPSWSLS